MNKLEPYIRVINYYETDQMHVVHHSNYARYLEEARLHMMDQLDLSYDELERMGIIIPVMELHDYYIKSITYGDIIEIRPLIIRLSPVRFSLKYDIFRSGTDELLSKIQKMQKERRPYYESAAAYSVITDQKSVEEITDEILKIFTENSGSLR